MLGLRCQGVAFTENPPCLACDFRKGCLGLELKAPNIYIYVKTLQMGSGQISMHALLLEGIQLIVSSSIFTLYHFVTLAV